MFTTTLTKTVASTREYRFAIGDIVCWHYKMDEPVEESSYEVVGRRIDGNGEQRYDLRFLSGGRVFRNEYARSGYALVRYVQPERGPLTETVETTEDVVVEHKFQVGDVVRIGASGYTHTITGLGLSKSGEPKYLWDGSNHTGDSIKYADLPEGGGGYGYELVGGPRFIQPHKFNVGDVIRKPNSCGFTLKVIGVEAPNRYRVTSGHYNPQSEDELTGDLGTFTFKQIEEVEKYELFTFPSPSRFKVGDKIQWPANVEHGGYYEVTAVHGDERYDIVSYDVDKGERYTQRLPESVTLYVEPELTPLIVLREARNLISVPEKWAKGTWDDHHGAYCLSGAINKACGGDSGMDAPAVDAPERKAWDGARQAIEAAIPNSDVSIAGFNDAKERTHEHVLAVLDKAIAEQVLATV